MLEEIQCIDIEQAAVHPPTFGQTFLCRPNSDHQTVEEILADIKDAMRGIATLGRAWDTPEEQVPPREEEIVDIMKAGWAMPSPSTPDEFNFWVNATFWREWTWWSSTIIEGFIKIDINCDALPLSTYTLEYILDMLSCEIIYKELWLDEPEALQRLADPKKWYQGKSI